MNASLYAINPVVGCFKQSLRCSAKYFVLSSSGLRGVSRAVMTLSALVLIDLNLSTGIESVFNGITTPLILI